MYEWIKSTLRTLLEAFNRMRTNYDWLKVSWEINWETTGRLQREPLRYYLFILGDYYPDTSNLRYLVSSLRRFNGIHL